MNWFQGCPSQTIEQFTNLTLLYTVQTDHTGMAVIPWKKLSNFAIWRNRPMKMPKTFLVSEKNRRELITCGPLLLEEDPQKIAEMLKSTAKNAGITQTAFSSLIALFVLFIVFDELTKA